MWLPFIPFIRHSKFNGWILVTRSGEVWVGGVKQTSSRYALLWEDAINRGKDLLDRPVTNVLMLGLAGGGALPAIYEGFPFCNITAVEIDPVMVDIAKRLGNYNLTLFQKYLWVMQKKCLPGLQKRLM
jgi:spermidine synthase